MGVLRLYKEKYLSSYGNYRFIASNTDKAKYMIGSLNGQPAKQVYQSILKVTEQEILTQTFKNPFGKLNGNETCIISIKEVNGNSLACFRQVNDSDVLLLLELEIIRKPCARPSRKFSMIFSTARLYFRSTACSGINYSARTAICRSICRI